MFLPHIQRTSLLSLCSSSALPLTGLVTAIILEKKYVIYMSDLIEHNDQMRFVCTGSELDHFPGTFGVCLLFLQTSL
jgi:hypothetical protein